MNTKRNLPFTQTGSGNWNKNRTVVKVAVKHSIITGLIIVLAVTGCRTTKTSVTAFTDVSSSIKRDSSFYRETVNVDTALVAMDTASVIIPYAWAIDTIHSEFPAPVMVRSGRASLSVHRFPRGLKITAQCDSLQMMLINKTILVENLRSELEKSRLENILKTDTEKIVRIPPLWFIIAMIVSVVLNVYFIIIFFRKRLLS